MATISQNNDLFTAVVLYSCEPENQAELIALLKPGIAIFEKQPGFISLNMHRSLDNKKVLVYLQWQSLADHEACFVSPDWNTPESAALMQYIQEGKATMDPQGYEVIAFAGN